MLECSAPLPECSTPLPQCLNHVDDQVLDDKGAGEAASFPCARTIPVLDRLLVEHDVARDNHLAYAWVVDPVCLGTFRVVQEHHRCAPILQLGEDRLHLPDVADAVWASKQGSGGSVNIWEHLEACIGTK